MAAEVLRAARPAQDSVTTVFDLETAFREAFGEPPVPPVTRFAFQMNTKDTCGGTRAYLQRVEFLARPSPERRLGMR